MKKLRIALLAHIRHPIAKPFMGGMEAHAFHLANALVARGHDVTLYASGDSQTNATLRPVIPVHYDRDLPWHRYHGTERLSSFLDNAFDQVAPELDRDRFDVVHNNTLHPFALRSACSTGIPTVTSLHVPPFKLLAEAVHATKAPWVQYTVCSQVQAGRWWSKGRAPGSHVVPNGIELNDWPFVAEGDGTAAWSGRITPTKGAHIAMDAAAALGMDLTLYGVIEHADYFASEIRPRLGGGIRYGGHLDQTQLAAAVGRASLYFFTPIWDEPFGLAAVEAMACGVPVAALPNGAVVEVIGPGGSIAFDDTAEALALSATRSLQLCRRTIRRHTEAAFAIDRMVDHYDRIYRKAISAGTSTSVPSPAFAHPSATPVATLQS